MMKQRRLGRTGQDVSVLSFGCGAVGGLMVRGAPADQERAVARALELGINYFDTATLYGNGESERNLGRVLKNLGRPPVLVATKAMLTPTAGGMGEAITAALDASLKRLDLERVDIFYLHNFIGFDAQPGTLDPIAVREEILPAFERLRAQGKTRFIGFTALGETRAVGALLPHFDIAQICFNVLNPTAGHAMPAGYPAQDYEGLLTQARRSGVGTVGIRVLAGGALSGSTARHALGMAQVDPLGSASTYAGDVARAQRLRALVEDGFAEDTVEVALRYALSHVDLDTTLIGLSTLEELERAAAAMQRGPLSRAALARTAAIQAGFAGEAR